jgi:hypothetical protein
MDYIPPSPYKLVNQNRFYTQQNIFQPISNEEMEVKIEKRKSLLSELIKKSNKKPLLSNDSNN